MVSSYPAPIGSLRRQRERALLWPDGHGFWLNPWNPIALHVVSVVLRSSGRLIDASAKVDGAVEQTPLLMAQVPFEFEAIRQRPRWLERLPISGPIGSFSATVARFWRRRWRDGFLRRSLKLISFGKKSHNGCAVCIGIGWEPLVVFRFLEAIPLAEVISNGSEGYS